MADSLREALATAIEKVEPVETAAVESSAEPASDISSAVDGAIADRARDEAGRFARAEAAKNSTAQAAPVKDAAVAPITAPAAVEPVAVNAPASWKKEYWEQFKALPPDVQKYIGERESQFQSGVSTYKQEAERAKELWGAIAPFTEDLQRYNVNPAQWINQLGTVHQRLATGSIQDKVATLKWVAQSYNIPLQAIQTGEIDPMTQQLHPLQEQVRQLEGTLKQFQTEREQVEQREISSHISAFANDPKNMHYEAVKAQMIGLLQSGMAPTLESAYEQAVWLNPETRQAELQRQTTESAERQRQEAAARVDRARSKTVSVRSDTPGSMSGDGKKGLRANLEEVAESVLVGGRV